MTNPYDQPSEYISTSTNWFNPKGVAHYTRPVPHPDIYQATNNTLNRIIAGDPTRVAQVEAAVKEKRAREDAATRQREAEEAAVAKQAQEIRKWRDYCIQRYVNRHGTVAEKQEQEERFKKLQEIYSRLEHEMMLADCHLELKKWGLQPNAAMDSKSTFDAWHSVDKPRRARRQGWDPQMKGGRQAPPPPSSSALRPDACCDFDYCHGFCANIGTPWREYS
jgi:hypothetical protein